MRVIVLGAGLLGVTSAYFLQQLGHEVTVIDRQGAPGAETSFANGGQISVSHAEPWANPSAPLKVLQWLGKEDAPLLFRLRADMRQWLWGLSFLRNCTPARTRHNIEQIVRLGTYSRDTLQQLRAATGIQYDQRTQGILHFYTNQKEFDGALAPAEQMRGLGCERQVISADEAVRYLKRLLCGTGGDEHMQSVQWQRFCGLVRTQQISYGSFDRSRLLHASFADILAGKHTGSRLHNGPSKFTAGIEIALRHGILIHVHVHGRA